MEKNIKKKRKKNRFLYTLVLVAGLYGSWTFIDQQLKLHELYNQEAELNNKIAALKKEAHRLEKEKQKGNDPGYIEKIGREELKMVKPNEIIYIDLNKSKHN